jgi:hypothetical protein
MPRILHKCWRYFKWNSLIIYLKYSGPPKIESPKQKEFNTTHYLVREFNKEKSLGPSLFLKLKFSNIVIICTKQNINFVQEPFEYLLLYKQKV